MPQAAKACGTMVALSLIASAVAQGGVGTVAGAVGVAGAVIGAISGDIGVAVAGAGIGAVAGAIAIALAGTMAGEVVGASTVAVVGALAKNIRITRGREYGILLMFVLAMIVACLIAAGFLVDETNNVSVGKPPGKPPTMFMSAIPPVMYEVRWFI